MSQNNWFEALTQEELAKKETASYKAGHTVGQPVGWAAGHGANMVEAGLSKTEELLEKVPGYTVVAGLFSLFTLGVKEGLEEGYKSSKK